MFAHGAVDILDMATILDHADWLSGRVPGVVRDRIRQLIEIVGLLPHDQALAVITADSQLLAANSPLMSLLGEDEGLLESEWGDIMPGWERQEAGLRDRPHTLAFDDSLRRPDGRSVPVHVVATPIFADLLAGGESPTLAAWTLFMTAPTTLPWDELLLRRQLELRSLVDGVSTLFVDSSPQTSAAAFSYAVREIGLRLGVDRAWMFELATDRLAVTWSRIWSAETDAVGPVSTVTTLEDLPTALIRLESGENLVCDDVAAVSPTSAVSAALFAGIGLRAGACVPMIHDGLLIGVLGIGSADRPRHWEDRELRLLRGLADHFTRLSVDRWDEDHLVAAGECFVSFGAETERNLEHICAALGAIVGASFTVVDRRRGAEVQTVAGWRLPPGFPRRAMYRQHASSAVLHCDPQRPVTVADLPECVYDESAAAAVKHSLMTYVGFRLEAGGETVGALGAYFDLCPRLRSTQGELFRVLGRAACVEEERRLALAAQMSESARGGRAMERMVGTLSAVLTARDPYTADHERRVALLAVALAERLGVPEETVRLLGLAATVHDVGKIAVPAEILSKPRRLSPEEFAVVKQHPGAGHELLLPAELPVELVAAVLQHHERLDGSGYPAGLAGDEISLLARILGVADVVEAMSSDRPYRPSLGVERALAEIEGGRGTTYDAAVCDACLGLFRETRFRFA